MVEGKGGENWPRIVPEGVSWGTSSREIVNNEISEEGKDFWTLDFLQERNWTR